MGGEGGRQLCILSAVYANLVTCENLWNVTTDLLSQQRWINWGRKFNVKYTVEWQKLLWPSLLGISCLWIWVLVVAGSNMRCFSPDLRAESSICQCEWPKVEFSNLKLYIQRKFNCKLFCNLPCLYPSGNKVYEMYLHMYLGTLYTLFMNVPSGAVGWTNHLKTAVVLSVIF